MKSKKIFIYTLQMIVLFFWFVNSGAKSAFVPPADTQMGQDTKIAENEEALKNDDERISAIEDQVQDALKTLDEIQRSYPKQFGAAMEKFSNISFIQNSINSLLLPARCAELIQKGDFVRARDALNLIHIDDYEEVVKAAFKNDTENFIKIVDFADTLGGDEDNDRTLIFYEKLTDQAKTLEYSNVSGCYYATENIKEKEYNQEKWNGVLTKLQVCIISAVLSSDNFTRQLSAALNLAGCGFISVFLGNRDSNDCNEFKQDLSKLHKEIGL